MGHGQSKNSFYVTTEKEENNPLKIVKGRYTWIIENFENLTLDTGSCVTSERLKVDIHGQIDEYEIVFYPKGFNERTADYVSAWLKRISSNERLVQFTCEIPKANFKGEELVKKTIKKKLALESFLGWSALCKRSHILENEKGVLNNGNLVLIFNLETYEDKCFKRAAIQDEDPGMDARLTKLSENFKVLLQSHKHYDVTFEIERKTFYAHKAVLAARSPVFRTMFDSGIEQENEIIPVTDTNEDTFASMLLFIYSGECVEKKFEAVFRLYKASHKYELLTLTRICSMILIESLNLENAIKVVKLAKKHSDRVLQDAAVNFIAENFKDIQKKEEWLSLMKDSSQIANKIFECLTKIQ